MKNTLMITTDNDDLVSSVDDGTNTLFINDTEIPSTDWVGTGNYTTTVEGHSITIAKIASLTGNVMIEKVSSFSYRLVAVSEKYPVYQDAEGNVTVSGNVTDGTGNVLSNKQNVITNIGNWNGSDGISDKSISSSASTTTALNPDDPIKLSPGKYIVMVFVQWAANATGRRYINISDTVGATTGLYRWLSDSQQATAQGIVTNRIIATLNITSNTDLYINALQNSGSSLNTITRYNFVKIG